MRRFAFWTQQEPSAYDYWKEFKNLQVPVSLGLFGLYRGTTFLPGCQLLCLRTWRVRSSPGEFPQRQELLARNPVNTTSLWLFLRGVWIKFLDRKPGCVKVRGEPPLRAASRLIKEQKYSLLPGNEFSAGCWGWGGGRVVWPQLEWGDFRALGGSRSVVWVKDTVQGCAASNRVTDESDPVELLWNQIL